MKTEKLPFVLASSSPRRIELLKESGWDPRIIKPDVDEVAPLEMPVDQVVMYLALKKALWVQRTGVTGIILAADTVVYKDRVMGKPVDVADAIDILSSLRADVHEVYTGVALIHTETDQKRVFYEKTKVFFRDYTDQEIYDYIETEEAWDKAGGYAIQGTWGARIDRIEGDYHNVIGLPLARVLAELGGLSLRV